MVNWVVVFNINKVLCGNIITKICTLSLHWKTRFSLYMTYIELILILTKKVMKRPWCLRVTQIISNQSLPKPPFSKEHSCAVDFIELNYSCKKGKSRPDFTNLSVPIQKIYQRRNKLNKYWHKYISTYKLEPSLTPMPALFTSFPTQVLIRYRRSPQFVIFGSKE